MRVGTQKLQKRRVQVAKMNGYFENDLARLSSDFRLVFQVILWPLIIIGVIGNVGVLCCICFSTRKSSSSFSLKPFYKMSLVSLALADLLLLGSSGTNVLATVTNKTLLWKLSSLGCTLIPYFQTVSMLVTSLNLAGIALNRYSAIQSKHSLSQNSTGNLVAVGSTIIVWSVACSSSYPVLEIYTTETVGVINNSTIYTGTLCVTDRHAAATVYTALFAVIFVPLTTVFILVYILLALSIHRRKSPGEIRRNQPQISQDNSTASTNTTIKSVTWMKKTPTPIHIIRKRRTVKVILMLIGIFSFCRLPQWIYLLVKLHITLSGNFWWHLQVVLTSLSLLNATVHPFLYAFLNEALSLVSWIYSLCCARNKSMPVSQESKEVKEGSFSASIKVPRGPYSP
ncbi:5-hydroxytryptamine receptor 4 [Chelonus insularis]|uniref:5-hydroxytryptamine receptor 4 n=1 Tax=Chelonus insularis TaxID=460826 RepID=UPI00158A2EAA|nr:5-hydroxytryptamine receptor 4 [Chelonus insularis]